MIDTYTRMLEIVAETGDDASADAAVKKLVHHLKSRGRTKLLPSIARELQKIHAKRMLRTARVEVASEAEIPQAKKEAKEHGIEVVDVVVNESLVCGWRAQKGGVLVDCSGKKTLVEMYRRVVNS